MGVPMRWAWPILLVACESATPGSSTARIVFTDSDTNVGDTGQQPPSWECPWSGTWTLASAMCGGFVFDGATGSVDFETDSAFDACLLHLAITVDPGDGSTPCTTTETVSLEAGPLGTWAATSDGGISSEPAAECGGPLVATEPFSLGAAEVTGNLTIAFTDDAPVALYGCTLTGTIELTPSP